MSEIDLIVTLTGGLAAALVCGLFSMRIGLSPIVGYLLAGFVVSGQTPGFVANAELADQFAELGIILLMFGVGLQFHLDELLAVGRIAVPGALGHATFALLAGTLLGVAFGWGGKAGAVFGMAIGVESTVVLTRMLSDAGDLHTRTGHIALGWLVVEDLLTVLVLVLMPAALGDGGASVWSVSLAVALAIVKVAAMVALTFIGGRRLLPWILGTVAATRSRELFTLTVLVVALGVAVGSAKLFGVSMALGAFLGGMVVGRSEFSLRAAIEALPMRDAFAVLFFVSVGMRFDPRVLIESPGLIVGALAVLLLGKPIVSMAIARASGFSIATATSVALALTQIGEFSFILAAEGKQLGVLHPRAGSVLVAVAIITITLNPFLYRLARPLAAGLRRFVPEPSGWDDRAGPEGALAESAAEDRAVIVGYGPVGRTLARLLRENHIQPVIIEMNLETVHRLNAEGTAAVYGDATHRQALIQAGLEGASALIMSSSQQVGGRETIRLAREINPDLVIVARSTYLRDRTALHDAGADLVFSSEGEVALAMTVTLLERLGATPEQIDRERERIRRELFETAPPEGRPHANDAPPSSHVSPERQEAR